MSRGKLAGSPISFKCLWCRRSEARRLFALFGATRTHKGVELTGRTKPYKPSKYSALGTKSTTTSREYRCLDCGHVGWSNHMDLERLEVARDG